MKMQRYLVSLNNNGSFRKALAKGSVQEVWEGADVWEDGACGVGLSASLAFDKGRKDCVTEYWEGVAVWKLAALVSNLLLQT